MKSTARRILITCLLLAALFAIAPSAGADPEAPAGGIGTAVEWTDGAGASVVTFDTP